VKDRVSKLDEIIEMASFFFEDPEIYDESALKKWKEDSTLLVSEYRERIQPIPDEKFDAATLKKLLEEVIGEQGVGFGKLMMPLRIAVTGQGFGPDLFTSMELLGKTTVLRRIDTAIEKIG
jgi:glutamyl-tRNA synthetase